MPNFEDCCLEELDESTFSREPLDLRKGSENPDISEDIEEEEDLIL